MNGIIIACLLGKVNSREKARQERILFAITLFFLTVFVLGIWRLENIWPARGRITVTNETLDKTLDAQKRGAAPQETSNTSAVPGGKLVASKNGKNYYLPSCSGTNRIKEENKIWFNSEEEAERAGFMPAANCPGL